MLFSFNINLYLLFQQAQVTTPPMPITLNRKPSLDKAPAISPLPVQSTVPSTTVPQVQKPVGLPAPSPDKPKLHIISPIGKCYYIVC